MKKLLALLAATAFSFFGLAVPANAAATDTVLIWVGAGSGHTFNGTYDACTGQFTASGVTNGATGSYVETVTGSYDKATGQMTFTSVYGMDLNGVVDDSSGILQSAYAWTLTGSVSANQVYGSYVVNKTSVGGVPMTESGGINPGATWFQVSDNGGTCTPPPVLDAGNHGQCVSTMAKTLKGQALAVYAKNVKLVGYDCHLAA